jgi:ABC-2 type transport system ATP-binding protein
VLQALNLRRTYGRRVAVDDISLHVGRGEVLGLLGPNGAGKSTTIAMVCGLSTPDGGRVRVAGHDLATDPIACKRRIGLVTQDLALFEDLSTQANLETFGALYGLRGAPLRERSAQVLAAVGLSDRLRDKPATFSGGMKRRLHIACALMHDPDLLLLDEPTAGVDPQSRNAIFDTLLALKAAGKALVYTTHYMEEVERLADRIVIVDHGRVVAEGTLAELVRRLPIAQKLELEIDGTGPSGGTGPTPEAQRALLLQAGARVLDEAGGRWTLGLDELTAGSAAVLQAVQQAGWRVRTVASGRVTLEDVFLQLTGRQLRD